jgi:hypothetical protein
MNQKYFYRIILYSLTISLLPNCKVPYNPKLKSTETNALIVEGFIDGAAPVSFKLSRSRMLTAGDTATPVNELGAKVSVEDDHQNVFPLIEAGNGIYNNTTTLNLNVAYQYRLHIIASNGEEYQSDLVPFKSSPPIDTIGWEFKNGGVQTLLNTHDPNNSTLYYRWSFSETWQFRSPFESYYIYNAGNNTVIPRTEQVFNCWQTDSSTNIYLASTTNLSSDVINQMPLAVIGQHDPKLSVLYSILVTQYALDVTGYNYWLAMENNTQNVGSIFDPQPNETPGNIHCITNPSELVVGYISAGNSSSKRIFIDNSSMPIDWNLQSDCISFIIPDKPDSLKYYFGAGIYDPILQMTLTGSGATVYSTALSPCVDCTLKGTNIKPSFWP